MKLFSEWYYDIGFRFPETWLKPDNYVDTSFSVSILLNVDIYMYNKFLRKSSFSLSMSYEDPRFRSSHQRCSIEIVALKNFIKFTGKHLCKALLLITLLKKRLGHRCFPVNFVNFSRTPFSYNTSRRLLLMVHLKFKGN